MLRVMPGSFPVRAHFRSTPISRHFQRPSACLKLLPREVCLLLNMPAFTGHRTGQADFPHPALGQDFTLSRATPSAASEHLLELIGFPISRSFTTYCVCLELRSLPSTGVTRFTRYYEPLRHPRAPSLSLTGSGWSSLTTPWGFP